MSIEDLIAMREGLIASEPGPLFIGLPDRWYNDTAPIVGTKGPRFRCTSGHVSRMVLKSEALGRDACLVCMGPMVMTFPEDVDDPTATGARS